MALVAPGSGVVAPPAHSAAFRKRRFLNWFPLGLAYAFLYMGRYNLNVAKNALGALMTNEDFGLVFGAGTVIYGLAFVWNGPLTDRIGGKRAMLFSTFGAASMNLAMGLYLHQVIGSGTVNHANLRLWFTVLYGANMYFQSFGAVAIVKVNASWFHLRERGGFSGIFGTMIASGVFFAFTLNSWILTLARRLAGTSSGTLETMWVFLVPAGLLWAMFAFELWILRDKPSQAGFSDFDTLDASSGEEDVPPSRIFVRVLTHPVIITVALIEFCTGVVRQGVMQWYPIYAKSVLALPSSHPMRDGSWGRVWTVVPFFVGGAALFFLAWRAGDRQRRGLIVAGALLCLLPFLQAGWGGLLFVAGVIGGNVAGYVSDVFFESRRAPAAGGLYAILALGAMAMVFAQGQATTTVAESSLAGLLPGDRIVAVNEKRGLRDWAEVSEAFAAVPASCSGAARWDLKRHMCSLQPEATSGAESASPGWIDLEVERDQRLVVARVVDPVTTLKAGDRRTLNARPKATRSPYWLGAVVFLMSLCLIGTHGLLSGTATMDFGGRKGAATAVGMIDGFVYLGTAVQSVALGYLTQASWRYWPWFLMPFAVTGFLLCRRIWHARPQPRRQGGSGEAARLTTTR